MEKIDRFIDNEGKIKVWTKKREVKIEILKYLASKFQYDHLYKEKEVNSIIMKWHTFEDYFLLRRSLIDYGFLCRKKDCSEYWRNKEEIHE